MSGSQFGLHELAASGGSNAPYLVEDANASQGLADALRNIARGPGSCEYRLPVSPNPPERLDYDLVQVLHTPVDGAPEEVWYAITRGGCGMAHGGWYYDVPPSIGTPSRIIMCPCTCASFATGTVELYYGCRPRVATLP